MRASQRPEGLAKVGQGDREGKEIQMGTQMHRRTAPTGAS